MDRERMQGFTLLELLIVIGIIAILAGFASLSADLIRREQVSSATRELLADLQRARINAMTQDSKGFGLRFESPASYVFFKFKDCNNDHAYDADTCTGGTREEENAEERTLSASVVLKKTNPSTDVNNDILLFDRFGMPRNDKWGFGWITIVIRNEPESGLTKCISVSTNRVRAGIWGWNASKGKYECIKQ